jgi:hypothetical protein
VETQGSADADDDFESQAAHRGTACDRQWDTAAITSGSADDTIDHNMIN